MSDFNTKEQRVRGTVILSAVTALFSITLGAVSLTGESGLWPSFSRDQVYSQPTQSTRDSISHEDAFNECAGCPGAHAALGSFEVASRAPGKKVATAPRTNLVRNARRGEGQTAPSREVNSVKSLARSVKTSPSKTVAVSRAARAEVAGGNAVSRADQSERWKAFTLKLLPSLTEYIRATVRVAEAVADENTHFSVGHAQKCEKEIGPQADDVAGTSEADYVEVKDVGRALPVYLITTVPALNEPVKVGWHKTAKGESGERPAVAVPDCTTDDGLAPATVERVEDESAPNVDVIPNAQGCDASGRQED